MVAVVTCCILEIPYVGLDFFICFRRLTKRFLWHFRGERAFQGSGSNFLWRSGDFLSSESHRKSVFLVECIIELCINVQEILEFVVAVLYPNTKFLASVYLWSSQVTFICIALLTIRIVTKHCTVSK